LNTDLDLVLEHDPTALVAAMEAGGIRSLSGVRRGNDGLFYPIFETRVDYDEPDQNIAAMLDVIEGLVEPLRESWARCLSREFNIGYDCGLEPWAFNQQLSTAVLGRIAAAGATLQITIYPDRKDKSPKEEAPLKAEPR